MSRFIFLIVAFLTMQTALFAQDTPSYISEDYLWPTNASDYMSATFAETRAAHFHAGVDIGTWGREGFDVYAARDGVLYRVGISPRGYGNVLYLQHDDGSFTVYAHLQDFSPQIRAMVDSTRFQSYRHSFDEIVTHKNIRFSKGDVIGRSGSTGIGPPHLHFEIRSPQNTAINPKLAGVHIADSVSPVISALAIEPLSIDATVNGRKQRVIRQAERRGNQFDFGTFSVAGITGLAVSASDRSDNGRNVYAVYELSLYVNDEHYFTSRADSFPMASSRKILIDRVFPLLQQGRGGYQRLYVRGGNQLPIYQTNATAGRLDLPPGEHDIRIVAKDYYGNSTVGVAKLRVTEPENHTPPQVLLFSPAPPLLTKQMASGNLASQMIWGSYWFSPETRTLNNVQIRSVGSVSTPTLIYETVSPGKGMLLYGSKIEVRSDEFGPLTLYRIDPGVKRTIIYPRHGVDITFFTDSVFEATYVSVFSRNSTIHISPDSEPLRSFYEINIQLPDSLIDDPSVALYHYNERRKRYDYMDSKVRGNILTATVNRFGTFEIRRDTSAPTVSRPSIWQRSVDGQWFASVRAFYLDSGIDFNNVQFVVNGVRGIAEYDPFGDVIRYHNPRFSPQKGENVLELIIPDYAGNVRTERFIINR